MAPGRDRRRRFPSQGPGPPQRRSRVRSRDGLGLPCLRSGGTLYQADIERDFTMSLNYIKPEPLSIKLHPEINEKWIQKLIGEQPSVLGLGDLELRDSERVQPGGGRLDLLLQDPETDRRYEVEIQLGATDPSHIIRTIEYWDAERKRYPQYDHCAVLVAENITSRFLGVISLFNGSIPIIAIQMQAIKIAQYTTLVFTTVLDERRLGIDEVRESPTSNRAEWEKKAKLAVESADILIGMVHKIDQTLSLNFTKAYIGLARGGKADNILVIIPKKTKKLIELEMRLEKSQEIDEKVNQLTVWPVKYTNWGTYRVLLGIGDIQAHAEALQELIRLAYDS